MKNNENDIIGYIEGYYGRLLSWANRELIIKSLHKSGLGYQRIVYHLNAKNLKTYTGKEWKGNYVYAVLKRYKEREQKLTLEQKVFKSDISKLEVRREGF